VPSYTGGMELAEVMTAAVTTGHGGPEVIEIRHGWPCPRPKAGEALTRVTAAGVNNTDLWSRQGAYGTGDNPDAVAGWRGVPLDFPLIQGGDVTGVVVAVGSDEDELWVGRRVLVDPAAAYSFGYPSAVVGSEVDGGFAQYHLATIAQLHDVTGSPLSDDQLACLPIAYATALGMVERAGCHAGERVLVTGASGGVGSAAVQITAARGCHVVAYTSPAKADIVARSGADEVVVRGRSRIEDLPEVDVVLDVVGGEEFPRIFDRLGDGGRLATVGAIAGPVVQLDLRRLYLRQRRIIGSTMHTPEIFTGVAELARTGAVNPRVAATYPLAEIAAAQARFEQKDFVGKLILHPFG
jgi:NADPH:quinone reductase-like Zn-dependent oxidoreductase